MSYAVLWWVEGKQPRFILDVKSQRKLLFDDPNKAWKHVKDERIRGFRFRAKVVKTG